MDKSKSEGIPSSISLISCGSGVSSEGLRASGKNSAFRRPLNASHSNGSYEEVLSSLSRLEAQINRLARLPHELDKLKETSEAVQRELNILPKRMKDSLANQQLPQLAENAERHDGRKLSSLSSSPRVQDRRTSIDSDASSGDDDDSDESCIVQRPATPPRKRQSDQFEGAKRFSIGLNGLQPQDDTDMFSDPTIESGTQKEAAEERPFQSECELDLDENVNEPEFEVDQCRRKRSQTSLLNVLGITDLDEVQELADVNNRTPVLTRDMPSACVLALIKQRHALLEDNRCMIQPYTSIRLSWDAFVISTIVLVGLIVPSCLVYFERIGDIPGSAPGIILDIISIFWVIDVAVHFRTGFFSEGRLVLNSYLVAKRYAVSWLPIDVLSSCPLLLAFDLDVLVATICLLKLVRMVRILSLFIGLGHEYDGIVLNVFKVGSLLLLLGHCLSCLWRVAQRLDYPDERGRTLNDERSQTPFSLYLQDIYWVLMTMSTIGYGDISPAGSISRLFSLVAMLISPLVFGSAVSGMQHVTQAIFADPVERKIAEASRCMTRRKVSTELQRRVEHNLRQHLNQGHKSAMDPQLFALLTPSLQKELSFELLSTIMLSFPVFRNAPYTFSAELAQAHNWVLTVAGDIVAEEGLIVQDLVFVIHGRLQVKTTNKDATQNGRRTSKNLGKGVKKRNSSLGGAIEFTMGAWFGEACLFDHKATHPCTVITAVETELAMLSSKEYRRIVRKYPKMLNRHVSVDNALQSGEVEMVQLTYVFCSELMLEEAKTNGLFSRGKKDHSDPVDSAIGEILNSPVDATE